MKKKSVLIATVAATLLHAASAHALDLTGSWAGKENCTINGSKSKADVTALVTQSGTDLNVSVSGSFLSGTYNGRTIEDVDKPNKGAAGLVQCTNTNGASMVGNFVAKTDGMAAGVLKGRITYVDTGILGGIAVCKYSLKRTATSDPAVIACP
jgi:hypothetical protein